jgi:serine/threonine protein kinase
LQDEKYASGTVQSETSPNLLAGRFELITEIGCGGMGKVYKARCIHTNQLVALKIINGEIHSRTALERLVQEAKILGEVQHPNIVHVSSISADGGCCFIVMEYLPGQTLAELIEKTGPMGLVQFRDVFTQLAGGIAEAHKRGIVHRDIKPSNVMIGTRDDGTRFVKLLDFGISRVLQDEQRRTQTGELIGTPTYMSPEQFISSSVDARSDIYSLGCVMYFALAGKAPFESDNALELASCHVHSPLPQLTALQLSGMNRLIAKATAKDANVRYNSMESVLKALSFGEKEDVLKTQANPIIRKQIKLNRKSGSIITAVIALCCVVLALYASGQARLPSVNRYPMGKDIPDVINLRNFARKTVLDAQKPTAQELELINKMIAREKLKVPDGCVDLHDSVLISFKLVSLGYQSLGWMHDKQRQFEERDDCFRKGLEFARQHHATDTEVARTWAQILCARGQSDKATGLLTAELAYSYWLTRALNRIDYEKALQQIMQTKQVHLNSAMSRMAEGNR